MEDWRGTLPGGQRETCPVIVAEPGGPGLGPDALVDSVAALALELARRPWIDYEPEDWGTRRIPAGLAAWDWWTIDWERLPLTVEWARREWPQDRLGRLGQRFLPQLAAGRGLAARYFAAAAEGADSESRRRALSAAVAGYEEMIRALEDLAGLLPQGGDRFSGSDMPASDEIFRARPLIRQARDGERAALAALAKMLGQPALPPLLEDPLRLREKGRKLFTWRAKTDDSIYHLTFEDGELQVELMSGDEAEEMNSEVYGTAPQEPGWLLAVEPGLDGHGIYRVVQQPAAANNWVAVVRADDDRTRDENAPQLTVWALPLEE